MPREHFYISNLELDGLLRTRDAVTQLEEFFSKLNLFEEASRRQYENDLNYTFPLNIRNDCETQRDGW